VVTLRIVIDAPEEYRDRKSVTLFSDYYCEDGKHVDSQDASVRAPFWSFQVPSSINEPVQYGIGLDDPTGKDKPAVELKQIKIIPH
jgi:hypothetical protein